VRAERQQRESRAYMRSESLCLARLALAYPCLSSLSTLRPCPSQSPLCTGTTSSKRLTAHTRARRQDQYKQEFQERWKQKQQWGHTGSSGGGGGGGGGSSSWAVLGLRPGATKKEIKTAFRKQAFDCHPDRHPDDPTAMERFRKLCEAYEALTKR
jgi:hypothetical protein